MFLQILYLELPGVKLKTAMKLLQLTNISFIIITFLCSCATVMPQKTAIIYYAKNKSIITQIEETYKNIFAIKPIVIEFSDIGFNYVNIEIKTDSLRYIYEFDITKNKLNDTLVKFGFDPIHVMKLIRDMKQIKCTWINTLDYYVDDKKQNLIFMSMRPISFDLILARRKYYTLTFYNQRQYYDAEGRLLDKKNRNKLRIVNNEIFWRINDRVCYTISNHFR